MIDEVPGIVTRNSRGSPPASQQSLDTGRLQLPNLEDPATYLKLLAATLHFAISRISPAFPRPASPTVARSVGPDFGFLMKYGALQ